MFGSTSLVPIGVRRPAKTARARIYALPPTLGNGSDQWDLPWVELSLRRSYETSTMFSCVPRFPALRITGSQIHVGMEALCEREKGSTRRGEVSESL